MGLTIGKLRDMGVHEGMTMEFENGDCYVRQEDMLRTVEAVVRRAAKEGRNATTNRGHQDGIESTILAAFGLTDEKEGKDELGI